MPQALIPSPVVDRVCHGYSQSTDEAYCARNPRSRRGVWRENDVERTAAKDEGSLCFETCWL
jgi:hypothetical protein